MELNRRKVMALGASGAVLAAFAGSALAQAATDAPAAAAAADQPKTVDAWVQEFTGGAEVTEGGINLNAPEIAENGNTVPISVDAEGASEVLVLASGNPTPGVAIVKFGEAAGSRNVSTRIRLAQTQDVIALAKMDDGSFKRVSSNVKVTIGGCGG